jgi:hypothetical protein
MSGRKRRSGKRTRRRDRRIKTMLGMHHLRLSKYVREDSSYLVGRGLILTFEHIPLHRQTLRLALQSSPIPEVHHDAIGHLLAFEIRCKRSSEFAEMVFLDYAAI